jgi:SAM-dependent methyltransferase
MTANASQFVGNIPENYDRELGPNIFQDYAADLTRRVVALQPRRVLELAAGTGILTRRLGDALPKDVALVATDLNAPMLDVARAKFSSEERIEFRTADAMALPFTDDAFDLVVCQFGVMFFPDKGVAFREALRVLAPGGVYLFNTWGTHAENVFSRIAHETVVAMFPEQPPGFYRVPFSYADPAVVIADATSGGFAAVEHEAVAIDKQVEDVGAFAHGLIHGNPMVDELRKQGADPDTVMRAVETRLRATLGEPPRMTMKANVFTARER